MNYQLNIDGMHCHSCMNLLRMELEDAGLENNIETLVLNGNNTGIISLKNISESNLELAKKAINATGNYKVID